MAKTKYCLIIWPFPLYFCPIFVRKWPIQRKHFPVVLRAHLYIFGISGGRRTGITCMLIQNSTFYFFAPLQWGHRTEFIDKGGDTAQTS